MSSWSWTAGLAGLAIGAATAYAVAQMPAGHAGMSGPCEQHGAMHGPMHGRMMQMMQGEMDGPMQGMMQGGMMQGHQGSHGSMGRHRTMGAPAAMAGQPTRPGQEAFGAIQEVVRMLEADPKTDWSKVNITALREHLIDMDEVTLRAKLNERALDNGVEIAVTGEGRTLEAIKRMVPAHAAELAKSGWNAKTQDLPNGVTLTVAASDAKQAIKLKALGFMGIMVQGAHHQPHHLMMAKGEFRMR
jgi:hypothetical protein